MHVNSSDGTSFNMSVDVLNTIFPFHVIINSTGQIIQAGKSIYSLFMDELDESLIGKNISELFDNLHQNQRLLKSAFLGTGEVVRLQCRSSKRFFCGNAYLLDSNTTVESLHAKIILTLAKPTMESHSTMTNGDGVAMEKESPQYHSQISNLENDLLVVKESLRKKRMFVRYVSHEIRTPLNVALLGLKCMEEELLPSFPINSPTNSFSFDTHESPRPSLKTGELLDLVEDVKLSCNLAVELLNDLLLYEKIDDGLSGLSVTSKFSLRTFLREIEKSFRMQSKGAGINLQFQYENGPQDLLVDIDKMKVQQVLRNLFTNAMKFTPSGGTVTIASHMLGALPTAEDEGITFADCFPSPTLESENEEDATTKEEKNKLVQYVRISLRDTGCGISKADQEALFHQFAQVRADQLQQGQGSGLGLWIAAKIVSLHHGRIGVTSLGEGSGAMFVVDLPITGFATVSMPNILAELPPLVIPQNPLSMLSLSNDDGNNTTELPHFSVPVESRPGNEVIGSPMVVANAAVEAEPTVPVTAGITTASLASHMSFHRRIAENMIRTSSGLTAGSVGAPYSLALSSSSSASCVSTLTAPSICLSLGCSITSSPMAAQPNSSRYSSRRSTPTGGGPGFFAQQSARSTPTGTGPGFFSQQSARSTPTGTGPGFFSSANSHKSQSLHHSQSTAAMIHSYTAQMRMLIVDDAPSNRKMVRRLMRDRFQKIDEAENGLMAVNLHAEAFAIASQGNERAGYQVIMMDFTMPVMNGLEATRQIKARDPDVWIVGVTGAGHDEEIAAFMDAGADLVLLKPLNVHHFENFLLEKLRQKVAATAATATSTNVLPTSLGTPTSLRTNASSSLASSSDVSVISSPSRTFPDDSAAVVEPSTSFSTSTKTTTEGSVAMEDDGYGQYVTSTTTSEKLSTAAVRALIDESVEQQQCDQEEVDEVKNITPVPPLSVKPPSHRPSNSISNIQ